MLGCGFVRIAALFAAVEDGGCVMLSSRGKRAAQNTAANDVSDRRRAQGLERIISFRAS
jgi:hypothetical protein